ncbi:hypothetical protein [Macellibacteroides fermentans]|uniref:hypothetical protein n=1 Tax=Macellibacteroides fermentans TaxID=879969 RepID=UPI00406BE95E
MNYFHLSLHILEKVLDIFKSTSASQISELSHSEEAWTKYCNTTQMISYNVAFTLKAFDITV